MKRNTEEDSMETSDLVADMARRAIVEAIAQINAAFDAVEAQQVTPRNGERNLIARVGGVPVMSGDLVKSLDDFVRWADGAKAPSSRKPRKQSRMPRLGITDEIRRRLIAGEAPQSIALAIDVWPTDVYKLRKQLRAKGLMP